MNNDLNETNPSGIFVTSIVGCYNLKTDIINSQMQAINQRYLNKETLIEFPSSSTPLALVRQKMQTHILASFKLDGGRCIVLLMDFQSV